MYSPLKLYCPYTVPAGISCPPVASKLGVAVQSDSANVTVLALHEADNVLYCDIAGVNPSPAEPTFKNTEPVGLG